MKKYIKPNTEIHTVELQSMIAESKPEMTTTVFDADFTLGKEDNTLPSSESVWGEEE